MVTNFTTIELDHLTLKAIECCVFISKASQNVHSGAYRLAFLLFMLLVLLLTIVKIVTLKVTNAHPLSPLKSNHGQVRSMSP